MFVTDSYQTVAVRARLSLSLSGCFCPHQPRPIDLHQLGSVITRLVLSSPASLSSPGCFHLYCVPILTLSINRLFLYSFFFLDVAVVTSLTFRSFICLSDLKRQAFRSPPASFLSSPYLSLCYCLSRYTLCSHCAVSPYQGVFILAGFFFPAMLLLAETSSSR